MNSDNNATQKGGQRIIAVISVFLLGILVIYLTWVAIRLRIDFFDAYETLNNARKIATLDPSATYYWKRPFIFPLLLSPIFMIRACLQSPNIGLMIAHIACVGIFALLLMVFYKFLRLTLKQSEAWVGTWLLAGNTLLIHYAPFTKEDIAATMMMSAAFYFYWKSRSSTKLLHLLISGLCITLAMGTRYNLIPILFGILFIFEIVQFFFMRTTPAPNKQPGLIPKIAALCLVPVGLYFLTVCILYVALGLAPWQTAIQTFAHDLITQYLMNSTRENPNWNYIFLFKAIPIPFQLFCLAGIVIIVKDRQPLGIFFLIWLIFFFLFQTYIIAVREARYLFPIFPPIYYFVTIGIFRSLALIQSKMSHPIGKTAALTIIGGLAILLPAGHAYHECLKFQDPIYTYDLPGKISQAAKQKNSEGTIYWDGPFYTLFPKEFMFDPNDKVTYVYHFYKNAVEFYIGRPVTFLPISALLKPRHDKPSEPLTFGPGSYLVLKKDDVMIINRERELYTTSDLPHRLQPILVQKANTYTFELNASEGNVHIYTAKDLDKARITTHLTAEGFVMEGAEIPNGYYETYVFLPGNDQAKLPFGAARSSGNVFKIINPDLQKDIPIYKIVLFFFDSVEMFSLEQVYGKSKP